MSNSERMKCKLFFDVESNPSLAHYIYNEKPRSAIEELASPISLVRPAGRWQQRTL